MAEHPQPSGDAAPFIQAIVDATTAGDTTEVEHQLDLTLGSFTLGSCMDEVLFPAMREIGWRWQTGRLDIEAERLATEATRGWLERLTLRAPEPTDAPPLLLTCGPADQHSVGLEALGVLLRHGERRCRVLGARVPVRALTTAVSANRPSGVVVVSHLRANRLSATQSLRAAAAMGVQVFYAGEAFGSVRLRRNVPGTHLDGGLREACTTLLST